MKKQVFICLFVAFVVGVFAIEDVEARTRRISTGSSRGNVGRKNVNTRTVTATQEEEDDRSSSSRSTRTSSSAGNIHQTRVRSSATTRSSRTTTKKSPHVYNTSSRSTNRNSSTTRIYDTSSISTSHVGRRRTTTFDGGKRPRRTSTVRTTVTGHRRDRHSTEDDHIGNVRRSDMIVASSYTGHPRKRRTIIRTERTEHVGNVADPHPKKKRVRIRFRPPRRFPHDYRYWWRGHWYRFPVGCGHYPRYFYQFSGDVWVRVNRPVVYNQWFHQDYYDNRHTFVTNVYEAPEWAPRTERYFESGYVAKGDVEERLIVKTLSLTLDERDRVELLLDVEIIQNILASVNPENVNRYEYSREERQLILTAPEEAVLRIQTMVQDRRTFDEVYYRRDNLAADVISVVSPVFLEKDYYGAVRLGESNCLEIKEYLDSLDAYYHSRGKKCWYNRALGTVTIVDDEENIYRVWDLMNRLAYIPGDYQD